MRKRFKHDLTGFKNDDIIILRYSHTNNSGASIWVAQCKCGKEFQSRGHGLKTGRVRSCGCLSASFARAKLFRGLGEAGEGMPLEAWTKIKHGATSRKHQVLISMEYAYQLFLQQHGLCALSGVPIAFYPKTNQTASLDRIDSTQDYIQGNVQWIHKDINKMKNNMNENNFWMWIDRIYHHRSGDKGTLVAPSVPSIKLK